MGETVFLHYDQAALDREFNLRARHPDHPAIFARWAETSAAARAALGGQLDLAYGASPGERLNLFVPEGAGPAPLVVFIHGGYWQSLDKSDFDYLAPAYLAAGIAFASLNYDLAPAVSLSEILRQIRAALAWLARNSGGHGIDPTRLLVAGHSAGGHLAVMAQATDWPGQGADLPADLVSAAVSVSGLYDLAPIRLSYHQAVLGLSGEEAGRLSPLGQVPARAGPLVLAVGAEETAEFRRQQSVFAAAWRAAGHRLLEVELPGRHHFTAIDALSEPGHPLFEATARLALNPAGAVAI